MKTRLRARERQAYPGLVDPRTHDDFIRIGLGQSRADLGLGHATQSLRPLGLDRLQEEIERNQADIEDPLTLDVT